MKRVGIYSGTFDPVHDGHLAFAREAIKQCRLDKVFFLVEPRPRRKQAVKALEHRIEMVRLAIKNEPKFSSIVLNQQRFSADKTLPVLMELFKGAELHMLMGDDVLIHLAEWPHVDELFRSVKIIVGVRGQDTSEARQRLDIIQKTRGQKINFRLFPAPQASFASSNIRRQIKAGKVPDGVDPAVMKYIRREGLYSAAGNP